MSFLSYFEHHSSSYAIVFDIGSSVVRASFVHYRTHKPAQVFFTLAERIHYDDSFKADDLALVLQRTLTHLGNSAIEKIGTLPHISHQSYAVHVVIHAPWSDSTSRRIERTLQHEVLITQSVLKKFVATHFDTSPLADRVQYDSTITIVELNGYQTHQPHNKHAQKLAVTTLVSTLPNVIQQSFTHAFSDVFPEHTVVLHPFLYAALQLQDIVAQTEAFTFIDVGGSYTSLHTIENRQVLGVAAAHFGTEYLISALAQNDPDARVTATSELSMFLKHTCTPSQCKHVESLLKPVDELWTRTFKDACAQIATHRKLPTRAFISAPHLYTPWFRSAVERFDFAQFTITNKPLHAEAITIHHLKDKIIFDARHEYDLSIALGILHVHTLEI